MHLWSFPVLLLWSSGCCLSLHTFPFPLHVVHTENVDKASEVLKQGDESEVGNTTNFIHHAQVLLEFLPLLVSSVERISVDHSVLLDHAAWK